LSVVKTIKDSLKDMTKSEYQVATYCLGNLNDFAFDTLDVIAEKIGTSTTSVIRFCRRLGFPGYKSFQEQVRADFKERPGLPEKFQRARTEHFSNELLTRTVEQNVNCIEKTFRELPYERVHDAVTRLQRAKRVFTFGMRESFALAHYAYTRLLTVRENVSILNAGYNGELESLLSLTKEDVCLVFLFHRYTRQSLQILEILKQQGVPVILITSAPVDAVQDKATVLLPCYVDASGIKNTAVAPICLSDCLFNAVATENGDAALAHMKQAEALFRENLVIED